jgi:hypothetical protein
MRKASKREVDYSRGHARAHCGKVLDDDKSYRRCFIPPLSPATELGQCEKVSARLTKFIGAGCLLGRTANKDPHLAALNI